MHLSLLASDLNIVNFDTIDCFSSVVGFHQVTFDLGEGVQCEGDFSSNATITQSSIVVNSCYPGSEPRKKILTDIKF